MTMQARIAILVAHQSSDSEETEEYEQDAKQKTLS